MANQDKFRFFQNLIQSGVVEIRFNLDMGGEILELDILDIPLEVRANAEKVGFGVLNFSNNYKTPLSFGAGGISQKLSFGPIGEHSVYIPWENVFNVYSPKTDVYCYWSDSDPSVEKDTEPVPSVISFTQDAATIQENMTIDDIDKYLRGDIVQSKKSRPKALKLKLINGPIAWTDDTPTPPKTGHLLLVKKSDKVSE